MSFYKYNKVLKRILGKKTYKEFLDYVNKRVAEIFGKQPRKITKQIIYANTSAVLIISILKAENANREKMFEHLHINNLQSNKYFIKNDINEFINEFSKYIDLIVENMKK